MTDDLEQLRVVERADVYKKGLRAATLTRTPDGVEFRYLTEWVDADGPPVATTLPVRSDPVVRPGGAVPAYFSGLLPEGRRLGALRREVKTSADDELSLLLAVGADAVGDIRVVPEGVRPEQVKPRLEVRDFSGVRFADLLAELGVRSDRTALPGVQDKVSAGARFVLKLEPPEFPHLVENEAFFLRAARQVGIETVDAHVVHDQDGRAGLLVERFDRPARGDDGADALAVEDGCQVLGRPSADKYVAGTEVVFGALAAVCEAPLPAARTLLAQLLFAYVTGNGDAHAKNFSVVQTSEGECRVAPAYDLPTSQPYGDTTLALSIGGRSSGDFSGEEFVTLGARLGLPAQAVRRLIDRTRERSSAWVASLDELPFDSGQTRKLKRVAMHRLDRLAHRT
jgi:serine/threonine-protein kinase HipA